MKSSFIERWAAGLRGADELGGRPALCWRGEPLFTHGGLLEEARRVARELVDAGVRPGELVALGMEKSPEYLVGMLGVWCAGAAFLPLRPSMLESRRRWVMEDARPRGVLRSGSVVGRPTVELCAGETRQEEGLAYVIYTSGSSGRPRGVAVEHGGILPFVEAQVEAFQVGPRSRVLWYLSVDFDASLSDVLTTLLSGACIYLEDSEEMESPGALMELLREREITHVDLPPSLLGALDPDGAAPALQTVIIGGEVCPPAVVRRWAERLRLVSCYGPTEATVCTSMVVCDASWERPLIGAPLPGVRYEVENGELLISGDCVARGYLNRPEETAERFREVPGRRTFRTGDLVRVHADGALEFLGRSDRRVKVAGTWVHLEAIEVELSAAPGIRRVAVVPREVAGVTALVAFYEAGDGPLRWPKGLAPMRLEAVEALPVTSTGKVDLPALMERRLCDVGCGEGAERERYATPLEAAVGGLYGEVLGRGVCGREDDFFALGGDSLRALHLVALASRRGIAMTPEMLQRDGRVYAVARAAEGKVAAPKPVEELIADAEALLRELPPGTARSGIKASSWARILLTGATGSLGRRVLRELLVQTEADVICLVRGATDEAARHRLGVSSPRVTALRGDLKLPDLGLSPRAWEEACDVDAVVHLAAAVNLSAPYAELRGPNLGGTFEVLRLLSQGRPKALHYVSTLSVAVATDRTPGVVAAEPLVAEGRVWGGYAQSKWAAEWLVQRGAPGARIYRPGLLVGRGTARASTEMLDFFWRGTAQLRCAPREHLDILEVDITPADAAARDLVASALSESPRHYLHLAAPRPASMRTLLDALRCAGIDVEIVDTTTWRRRLLASLHHRDMPGYMLAMCRCLGDDAYARWRPFDLFQATGFRLDDGLAQTDPQTDRGISFPEI